MFEALLNQKGVVMIRTILMILMSLVTYSCSQENTNTVCYGDTLFWKNTKATYRIIEISRDGGDTYDLIDSAAGNSGDFKWAVTGPGTTNALIKTITYKAPKSHIINYFMRLFGYQDNSTAVILKSYSIMPPQDITPCKKNSSYRKTADIRNKRKEII